MAPIPEVASKYAMLLRGRAYEFGCDMPGIRLQEHVLHSHHAMISEPLEELGHTVDVFLALSSACDNVTDSTLAAEFPQRLSNNKHLHNGRLKAAKNVSTFAQHFNIRSALNMIIAETNNLAAYDFLVVMRYDIRMLRPITSWDCRPTSLGSASILTDHSWRQEKRTSDLIYVVPKVHWPAFNVSIGKKSREGCCYNNGCHFLPYSWGNLGRSGHWCIKIFDEHVAGGMRNMSFCFAKGLHGGCTAVGNHSVRVPTLQCCKKAGVNWTYVGSALDQYARETQLSMRAIARLPRHELSNATATSLALNGTGPTACGQYGNGSLDPMVSTRR